MSQMSVDKPNCKISVITASYNYENYIKETIESVLNQTYGNWELIIADDGSSDSSVEIIKEYCKKDSRIKLFSHPNNQNLGLKDTLLLAIKQAQGEWVAFLESDDIFKPEALEEKIKIAQENADVKIIFSDVEMFGDEESIEKLNRYLEKGRCFLHNKKRLKENDLDFIVNRNFVPTFSCVMAKREKLLNCDFNTPVKQCLDIFLWAQFAACDFYYTNKKLTGWRMHKTSYINSANSNIKKNAEFTSKLSYFVYSNKKHTLLNRLKYGLQYLNCLRKKSFSIRLKSGEIVFLGKEYNFKKIPQSEIAKIDTNKNRVAVFAHWDKDCLIEDYVIYYLKSLKNIVQKIIFVSDCDVKQEELKKLNGIADVAIAKRHGEYDFGSYKRGFLYAKENNLLTGCDELIFANDSCYAPLFPFENMFAVMEKKQVDFWGNTINYQFFRHVQSYFLVFGPNVFNSKVFNKFVQNIKKENSKTSIISNYECKLTELLEHEGFKYSSYCKENPQMLGLHIKNWKDLIKKNKSSFLKTSVPRLKNVELVSALNWKGIIEKYTNYNTGLINKDLKRNRKKTDVLKEIILTPKHLRRKIIRIHFKEKSVYIFDKHITDIFPALVKSKIKAHLFLRQLLTNEHKKKRMLFIGHELTPTRAPIVLLQLIKILKQHGYDAFCIYLSFGEFYKQYVKAEIPLLQVSSKEQIFSIAKDFDLCICNTFACCDIAIELQKILPVILYIHEGKNIFLIQREENVIKEQLNKLENIIAVSEAQKEFLETLTETPIKVCHNAIEDLWNKYTAYRTHDYKIKFLFAGDLIETKGIEVLFEAFKKLNTNKAELHFLGRHSKLSKKLKKMKCPNVYFHKPIHNQDKKNKFFISFDVFVLASFYESSSLFLMEGAMFAKPLITTRYVGAKYLVEDNKNGFIIPENNVDELAKKLQWFIDNPEKIKEMGEFSREKYLSTSTIDLYTNTILKTIDQEKEKELAHA